MKKARVIIVGAGINGLATAWALLRRGYQVEVFDKGGIPNPVASSYDEHRMTRHCYGTLHGYAEKMPETFRLWDALFADVGARHFEPLPFVALERETAGWIEASAASMDRLGVAWRDIPLDEVAQTFPMIRTDGLTRAAEYQGTGMLFPVRILTDLVVYLAANGVIFHQGTEVTAVDPETGHVVAGEKTYSADHVVIAAGAWVTRLLPELAELVVPSRQATMFMAPPPAFAALWRTAPLFLDFGIDSGSYAMPPRPGTRLKIGDHVFTRHGDPDASRVASDADLERLITAARVTFTDFDAYIPLERKACYYTVTDDEHFIIRPLGARGTVVSACSGHGFKLAPFSAEKVAQLVENAG
jgi:glycine/D-amino acid oxidase-like deaminating enzyme